MKPIIKNVPKKWLNIFCREEIKMTNWKNAIKWFFKPILQDVGENEKTF